MGSQWGVWGVGCVLRGPEGPLGSGVRVLAVGLEGADREQLRRVVTSEDPRYIYHGNDALAELEGELTDDLCTIISTRVRGQGTLGGVEQEQPHRGLGLLLPPGSHGLPFSRQPEPEPKPKPCTVQCPRVSIPVLCHAVPRHADGAQGPPSLPMAAVQGGAEHGDTAPNLFPLSLCRARRGTAVKW